jgi:hypothetical protein
MKIKRRHIKMARAVLRITGRHDYRLCCEDGPRYIKKFRLGKLSTQSMRLIRWHLAARTPR